MDFIVPQYNASDESSCGDSSGPITPINSPLVHPIALKSGIEPSIDHLFDLDKNVHRTAFTSTRRQAPYTQRLSKTVVNTVCFIGAGYVGGPTAATIALHHPDIHVTVVDKDEARIQSWKSRHLPIYEPGLMDIVRICRDGAGATSVQESRERRDSAWKRHPNLFFTTDVATSISQSDVIFLAVNTSTKTFGMGKGRATDMSACDAAVKEIAAHAKPGTIIVEKSTVPCGTAARIRSILSTQRPNIHFEILSNPEFLAEGCAMENLMNPDRVIIGSFPTSSGRTATDCLAELYGAWIPADRILTCNVWSSELSKLVANAMLAQRISSINSISAICEATGADVQEIAKSIGCDSRIGPHFLKAGLGFGGSCFKKDIRSLIYLAESLGLDEVAEYWSQVDWMNEYQHQRFARRVIKCLNGNLVDTKIAILGFAFKANTGDTRQSLAAEVVRDLLEERPAEIAIYDPYCKKADILRELPNMDPAKPSMVNVYADAYGACHEADAILIVTDCEQFKCSSAAPSRRLSHDTYLPPAPSTTINIDYCEAQVTYTLSTEPACTADCQLCAATAEGPSCRMKTGEERLDWSRILARQKVPRWIFDGRGVIEAGEIGRLGFPVKLESIGKGL